MTIYPQEPGSLDREDPGCMDARFAQRLLPRLCPSPRSCHDVNRTTRGHRASRTPGDISTRLRLTAPSRGGSGAPRATSMTRFFDSELQKKRASDLSSLGGSG